MLCLLFTAAAIRLLQTSVVALPNVHAHGDPSGAFLVEASHRLEFTKVECENLRSRVYLSTCVDERLQRAVSSRDKVPSDNKGVNHFCYRHTAFIDSLYDLRKQLKEASSNSYVSKIGCLILLVGFATLFRLCAWPVIVDIRAYQDAEQIVDEFVVPFRHDLMGTNGDFEALLSKPKYEELRGRSIPVDRKSEEVVRFRMNEIFEIGVMVDGSILWHKMDVDR